jgi:hypothetical protein
MSETSEQPPEPLPSEEQKRPVVASRPGRAAERLYGSVPWKGDPEELRRFLEDPDEGMWGTSPSGDPNRDAKG